MIGSCRTGLGNENPVILDNLKTGNEIFDNFLDEMFSDAIEKFFSKYGRVDFGISNDADGDITVQMGIEPTYKFDPLYIIGICENKAKSYRRKGIAWGLYGSEISSSTVYYSEFKYKTTFLKFVEKWSERLAEVVKSQGKLIFEEEKDD
jgi:hypothetical protein